MSTLLVLAMLLDAALGEPRWLWQRFPHPAVLMGRCVGALDTRLNRGKDRRARGILALVLLVTGAAVSGAVLSLGGPLVEVVVAAILLAQRSLVDHVRAVAHGLRLSLREGRRAVARIVSRNTGAMDQSAVARAAIESGSENLSDGVIAPALWFLVGGLPGLLVYKVVNTADSMIGYRTPRYADFGWAAARTDDVLNWIPARLTAVLIALPAAVLPQWPEIRADAGLHRSPNAGWPEAAMARALGVALAGPRAYDGRMQEFAWVNGAGARAIGPAQIDAAVTRLWQAWGVMLGLALVIGLLTS
jgi:adenosylcobinamide-phosphate synthase